MIQRLGLIVAFCLSVLSGCGGGNNSPTEPDGTPVGLLVVFNMPSGGSVSATLDGKTYTQSPDFRTVPSGTLEIAGTFSGGVLDISFGSSGLGGVKLNSVKSLSGPSPFTDNCGVTYTRSGSGTSTFRLQFDVITQAAGHC